MRNVLIASGFMLFATTALGETVVESCFSGMPASEGGETTTFTTNGEVRLITVDVFGHTGRLGFSINRTGENDAVIHVTLFKFAGLLDEQGNPIENPDVTVTLESEGRAILVNGAICDETACFYGNGLITKEWVQDLYEDFSENYPNRFDCTRVTID